MSIVELCIRTAATKAARPCRRIYPKGTQTFGRVPAFLRLFLFDAVKTNNLFLERNKNSNTCWSFLFRFAFRGARLSPILGRGDGAISLFLFRCALFRAQTRSGRCKSGGRSGKVGCFWPKTVGFSTKVHCFFLSLGRKGAPPAPFGAKSPRSKGEVGVHGDAFAHGGASASPYIRRVVRFSARKLCVSAEKP